jgi:hypothetical protein
MAQIDSFHGGLLFYGDPDCTLLRGVQIVADTLRDYGYQPGDDMEIGERSASLNSPEYAASCALETRPPSEEDRKAAPEMNYWAPGLRQRMVIRLEPAFPEAQDKEISELLMAVILYRMVRVFATEQLEWMDPETTLTVDQFASAFANIPERSRQASQATRPAPEFVSRRPARFAPIEQTRAQLEQRCDVLLGSSGAQRTRADLIGLSDDQHLARAMRKGSTPFHIARARRAQKAAEAAPGFDLRRLLSGGFVSVRGTPEPREMAGR